MEALGAVSQRARLGYRARGLQRKRRCLELPATRPGPLARLSLERGWPGGNMRQPAAAVLRASALEWRRPHPERAAVRPSRPGGQSWRGREGVLLLPRLDPDALVHEDALQIPAA